MPEEKDNKEVKKEDKPAKEKVDHKKQAEEMENNYMRALADYQNLLKRTALEKMEFVKYANEQLLMEFIPVYDNLKISLKHIDEKDKENPWVKGIEYVIKMFHDLLEGNGVTEIKTVGEKFDPHKMEAMPDSTSLPRTDADAAPADSAAKKKESGDEKVAKEISSGYELNGKIIKAAKVILE